MNIVNEKKLINIADANIYSQLTTYLQQIINEWQFEKAADFKYAFKIYLEQNPNFIKMFPNEYTIYNELYVKCKFLTLSQFVLSELVDFFREHWIEQYDITFYTDRQSTIFFDLFDACMMGELIYEDRDEWKNKIIKSLKENNQVLFTVQNKEVEKNRASSNKVTVGELIVTFENNLKNKRIEFITITNYLDRLQKEYTIDEQIKNKIAHLLKFYKVLVTSSMDALGAEEVMTYIDEEDHKFKVLKKGIIEEIKMDNLAELEKTISSLYELRNKNNATELDYKSLIQAYRLTQVDWDKIVKESNKILGSVNIESEFQKNFHNAINTKNSLLLITYLFILAQKGHLDEIFERDIKIKEIFKAHLAKKFTAKLASHFEANLREPVYLSYFLQHILKDILKLNENESAVLAIKLVNELKRAGDKQYLPIAYGDLKEGIFKWKGIVEKDDKLELEK